LPSSSLPPLVEVLILIIPRRCGNEHLRPALLQRYVDLLGRAEDLLLLLLLQVLQLGGSGVKAVRRRRHGRRQRLWPLLVQLQLGLVQLMQLQLGLDCGHGQWLPVGQGSRLRLRLVADLLHHLWLRLSLLVVLLRLLLVLYPHLGLLLRLLVGHHLAMLLLGLLLLLLVMLLLLVVLLLLLLRLMLDAWPWSGGQLLLLVIVTLMLVVVFREVTLRIAQCHIGLALVLLEVDRLVKVVVHYVVLGGLLADVVVRGRHADQMDLVEGETLGADP